MNKWVVVIADRAENHLKDIKDSQIQKRILQRIERLQYDPDKQGKPLEGNLEGIRSVRAVGQRYRILYRIEEEHVIVVVVTIGIRKDGDKKDAYELAKKLAKLNLLG
jgi:mRNA interferase RelE/StbE